MADHPLLLDTPRRTALAAHAGSLRTILKEWEQTFAAAHAGSKPGREDIKQDGKIAAKYKEYNRVRDVLSGKLGPDALDNNARAQSRRSTKPHRQRSGTDAVDGPKAVPGKAVVYTPRKPRSIHHAVHKNHPSQLDPNDRPSSASPAKPFFLDAVGPTPQRDGKFLGLFDLLSNSGGSSQATPSARKRKVDALAATSTDKPAILGKFTTAHTPSQKRTRGNEAGDVLDHIDDGENASGGRRHSRTPASEGRRFMLSHFFATPSTMRFAAIGEDPAEDEVRIEGLDKTPLRTKVLGTKPDGKEIAKEIAPDATPVYLKRNTSFSFKQRLLSAAGNGSSEHISTVADLSFASPTAIRTGPPTLRAFKAAPKALSEIVRNLRQMEDEQHDDDLDALREMEGGELNVLVGDSQARDRPVKNGQVGGEGEPPARAWKKKGQKRTTRRVVMRPVRVKPKPSAKHKRVAEVEVEVDGDDQSEDFNEIERVEETQALDQENEATAPDTDEEDSRPRVLHGDRNTVVGDDETEEEDQGFASDPDFHGPDCDEAYDFDEGHNPNRSSATTSNHPRIDPPATKPCHRKGSSTSLEPKPDKRKEKRTKGIKRNFSSKEKPSSVARDDDDDDDDDNDSTTIMASRKRKVGTQDRPKKPPGGRSTMINPNAVSHMNFRSLKIRNKNSKAKGRSGGGGGGGTGGGRRTGRK